MQVFQTILDSVGFQEIQTPKIIPAASEGGANVSDEVFRRRLLLGTVATVVQRVAINADVDRVFTVGPVFRAEDSNTHRHLCEFTGLDMEMAFNEHYHEVLDVLEQMFVHISKQLQKNLYVNPASVVLP